MDARKLVFQNIIKIKYLEIFFFINYRLNLKVNNRLVSVIVIKFKVNNQLIK